MSIPHPHPAVRQALAEALTLSRSLINASSELEPLLRQRRQDRLRHLQHQLKQVAHPIQQDPLPLDSIPSAVRQAFVRATLMVSRYHQLAGSQWQGTLQSPTLTQFRPDPIPEAWQDPSSLSTLCRQFGLDTEVEHALEQNIQTVDEQIQEQKRILAAVLQSVTGSLLESGEAIQQLFQALFGVHPFPAEVFDCVYTETQLYFCLDYHQTQLRSQTLWETLTCDDQARITRFLESIQAFSFQKFGQFPTFGPCLPHHIDDRWCEQVARSLEISPPQLRDTLRRSVSILATAKTEAFLVHDIWGHGWQWILTQFQSEHAILTSCGDPLRGAETAYTPDGPLSCWDLFEVSGQAVTVKAERARLFFQGEVQQRLGLVFTHVLSELIADAAEFKFIGDNPEAANQLMSSSIFKHQPTKLDLGLTDIDFMFLRVLQPLLEPQISMVRASALECDLLTYWSSQLLEVESIELQTSLKQAILRLHQIFLQEYEQTYLPSATSDTSWFALIICNLLQLQNVINYLLAEFSTVAQTRIPFRDLLLVFIGSYCSTNSYDNFWMIDDVLARYFIPCWYQLQQSDFDDETTKAPSP